MKCVGKAVVWAGEMVRWECDVGRRVGEVVRREGGVVQAECVYWEGVVGREGNEVGESAVVRVAGAVVTGEE